MTDRPLRERLIALAEREDGIDQHAGMEPENGPTLREAVARIEQLEIQLEAVHEANASLATDAGLWAKPSPAPLRLVERGGDLFIVGLSPLLPEDGNPPGLEVSFERMGELDAYLDALPYGVRGTAPAKEAAAQSLLAKLQAALADPAALFMQLSDAAEEDAEVDSDELWAESKVWALASGIVAAARLPSAAEPVDESIKRAEQVPLFEAGPGSAGEPLSAADAPLFRLARKAWSSAGLTPEDIEAEGHRFRAGSGGYASIAVLVASVEKKVPNRADCVPALARLFVGLFEPIPKP